jgi:membrane associated rhomboid family serine protease
VSRRQRFQFDREQLRITHGAMLLLFVEVGLSLVWLFVDPPTKAAMAKWLVPTGDGVWRQGHVWTLLTGPLLEIRFLSLLFQGLILWLFVPAIERWWGTPRFLRFALYTSLAGTVLGSLADLGTGRGMPIAGLDPFIYASIIAFGITYARQPVQFFGVLPMTGRQLMYGIIGFVALFVLLQRDWEVGAAYVGSMGVAALLTNQRWNPRLAWLRHKKRRDRAHLSVLVGGKSGAKPGAKSGGKGKKPDQWLN